LLPNAYPDGDPSEVAGAAGDVAVGGDGLVANDGGLAAGFPVRAKAPLAAAAAMLVVPVPGLAPAGNA
jgi:hypothetical protein